MTINKPDSKSQQNYEVAEFEITYTEQALLENLQQFQLDPDKVISLLKVNINTLNAIVASKKETANSYLTQLENKLKIWPAKQSLTVLTANINQLVFLWLNAMQDGVKSQTILSFMRCFELKPAIGFSQTAQLHCFMFNLVAETAQLQQKKQLEYALNFDVDTKLPHSNQILIDLNKMTKVTNSNQLISLFSIHFQISKNNPIYSHSISVSLSQKIINLLKQNIGADCQLYYDGNLEFDILLDNLNSDLHLNLLAAKLGRAFEHAIFLENQSLLVTPFIGCASVKNTTPPDNDLYSCAKLALKNAIENQQHFVMFSEALQHQLATKSEAENKVLEAFASDSLTFYFQPIVTVKNSKIAGAELLLRWSDMTGYTVAPGLTVEILNQSGKGKLFTRWLINSACRYASELTHEHQLKIYLTINLRAEDLYDIELPHLLMQSLALWRVNPQDIVLEITENGVLEYNETSQSVIDELFKNGFRLALDDFGTGFSSLSRLRSMPIDLIKIDQSFVRDIKHSKQDFEIVKSIAMLANSLGKEVLAEGVEDEDCLALIKKMKIDKCQGYFFAKPMPFEQFVIWAKEH